MVLQAYSRQMVVLCFNRALSMDTGSGSKCLIIPFFQLGVVQISDHPAVQPPIRIHVSIQYRASGLRLTHQDFMVQVSFEHCSSRYMANFTFPDVLFFLFKLFASSSPPLKEHLDLAVFLRIMYVPNASKCHHLFKQISTATPSQAIRYKVG